MNITMANGALLVSPLCLPEPFVPGVHHIEASLDELSDTISRYLEDDEARERITSEAHRFLTTELTLERSFSRLLEPGGYPAGGVKDVRPDYYVRLHAVEEQHWWHVGMREIAAALLSERLAGGH